MGLQAAGNGLGVAQQEALHRGAAQEYDTLGPLGFLTEEAVRLHGVGLGAPVHGVLRAGTTDRLPLVLTQGDKVLTELGVVVLNRHHSHLPTPLLAARRIVGRKAQEKLGEHPQAETEQHSQAPVQPTAPLCSGCWGTLFHLARVYPVR